MKLVLGVISVIAITFPGIVLAGSDDHAEDVSVWINPGFYSIHFEPNKGFRDNNYGLGLQVAFSKTNSVLAGVFRNSDNAHSRYVGWVWQPLELGSARLGFAAGLIDGYPKMQDGKPFLAAIPMASLEYKRVGANVTVIPSYGDKLHGAISIQLKLKVW